MIDLLYFHGLGSNKDSRKFKLIENTFDSTHSCFCVEWEKDTDISELLTDLWSLNKDKEELVLIGDSTGGNYAYQLRERLKVSGVKIKLVLLNPLLDFSNRIANFPFPKKLEKSLEKIKEINHCFLLQSNRDEVIDHSKMKIGLEVEKLIIDDTHRLLTFEKYVDSIKEYIEKH